MLLSILYFKTAFKVLQCYQMDQVVKTIGLVLHTIHQDQTNLVDEVYL